MLDHIVLILGKRLLQLVLRDQCLVFRDLTQVFLVKLVVLIPRQLVRRNFLGLGFGLGFGLGCNGQLGLYLRLDLCLCLRANLGGHVDLLPVLLGSVGSIVLYGLILYGFFLGVLVEIPVQILVKIIIVGHEVLCAVKLVVFLGRGRVAIIRMLAEHVHQHLGKRLIVRARISTVAIRARTVLIRTLELFHHLVYVFFFKILLLLSQATPPFQRILAAYQPCLCCLAASARMTDAAVETLKELTLPYMGIEVMKSASLVTRSETPLPSLPNTSAQGPLKSVS